MAQKLCLLCQHYAQYFQTLKIMPACIGESLLSNKLHHPFEDIFQIQSCNSYFPGGVYSRYTLAGAYVAAKSTCASQND